MAARDARDAAQPAIARAGWATIFYLTVHRSYEPPKFIGGSSQVVIGPSSVLPIVACDSLGFAIAPPTVGVVRKAFLWDMILIYRRMHRVGLSM